MFVLTVLFSHFLQILAIIHILLDDCERAVIVIVGVSRQRD